MTCKDCIHEELCMDRFKKQYPSYANKNITVDDCEHFKNKADFVKVVRCQKCAYREACNKEIYVEHSYTSIGWCSEGERKDS